MKKIQVGFLVSYDYELLKPPKTQSTKHTRIVPYTVRIPDRLSTLES